jgi:hypothetical protein
LTNVYPNNKNKNNNNNKKNNKVKSKPLELRSRVKIIVHFGYIILVALLTTQGKNIFCNKTCSGLWVQDIKNSTNSQYKFPASHTTWLTEYDDKSHNALATFRS